MAKILKGDSTQIAPESSLGKSLNNESVMISYSLITSLIMDPTYKGYLEREEKKKKPPL